LKNKDRLYFLLHFRKTLISHTISFNITKAKIR